jgi:hypothetical protein
MPRVVKIRRLKFFQIVRVFRSVPRKTFTLYPGTGLRLVVSEEDSGCGMSSVFYMSVSGWAEVILVGVQIVLPCLLRRSWST